MNLKNTQPEPAKETTRWTALLRSKRSRNQMHYFSRTKETRHARVGSDFSASGACVQSCKHHVWAFGSSSDDAVSICKINPAPAAAFFHNKIREVIWKYNEQVFNCSCMLFESVGILCRHIIRMLRGARISELPMQFITKRWTKNCKR